MQQQDKSFEGLILSLIIHVAIVLLVLFLPDRPPEGRRGQTEITILDTAPVPKLRPTQDAEVDKKQLDDLRKKAEFLAQQVKRVKEQTRARNLGRTQNSPLALPTPQDTAFSGVGRKQNLTSGKNVRSSLAGLQPKPRQVGEVGQEGLGRKLVLGSSSIGEMIPGIREGSFTALNTDQFTYYTFFSRINEAVRYPWVTYVRNFTENLPASELAKLAQFAERTTHVEIVLDANGKYLKSFIHRSSGSHELDMTGVSAFQNSREFPNPPKGLVEEDNLIHLHYLFTVSFRPRTGIGSN